MKNVLLILVLALGLAAFDADAKRLGGGGNVGKQRATPTNTTAKESTAATPAPATPATPSKAPAPAQPQGFMSKWGGMIAGLGIGALLGSMFGGGIGGALGGILMMLLVGAVLFLVVRFFMSRGKPAAQHLAFEGANASPEAPARAPVEIGSRVAGSAGPVAEQAIAATKPAVTIPGFDTEAFERVAKTSFIRLQAANDAKDLDDIRDFTTPEVFAEIAMQAKERGEAPQKTEVLNLEAKVVEAVVEDGYEIASVRFSGLIRENATGNPEPLDEIWHVRKKAGDRKATWLIAGIQQVTA